MPFVKAHASATKNGKLAEMHLHLELVAELRTLNTDGTTEDDFIFGRMPRIERFRRDLKPAGIPLHDARGREVVFHSLRHMPRTNLARGGVGRRVAMTLMRHTDRRLTDKTYTDESLLETASAIDLLLRYSSGVSQIASQKSRASGLGVSSSVAMSGGVNSKKTLAGVGKSQVLTLFVAGSQNCEDGGSGGARTRNLCRDRAAL